MQAITDMLYSADAEHRRVLLTAALKNSWNQGCAGELRTAAGVKQATHWVLLMFFCVSLLLSNQWPQPRCCLMSETGMAVS